MTGRARSLVVLFVSLFTLATTALGSAAYASVPPPDPSAADVLVAHTTTASTTSIAQEIAWMATGAAIVLALGVVSVLAGPLVGGAIPAVLALLLARQARADMMAGQGYLTGARSVRTGVRLAWLGLALAVAALIAAIMVGLFGLVHLGGVDFPDRFD